MKEQPAGAEPAKSVYQRVTEQVLAELAQGTVPWRQPWRAEFGLPRNLTSRRPYRGINILTLMISALTASYPTNWWLTFKQAQELGGHINKGEHGRPVVFYQRRPCDSTAQTTADDAEDAVPAADQRWRSVLKVFTVFNAAQCTGIAIPAAPQATWQPLEAAERIVEAAAVPIRYLGVEAFYQRQGDQITLPPRQSFATAIGFYETLLHELVHATGHEQRLARPHGPKGTEAYAWEELIAEMGSAMLAVIVGVPAPDFPNFAAYLDFWRKRMQRDPQAIGEAAGAAQKAVEWLLTTAHLPLPQ